METIIDEDSPLAAYLEGEGGENIRWASCHESDAESDLSSPSFAPRGKPAVPLKFRQKLPPPLQLTPSRNTTVAAIHNTCSEAVNSRLGRADNEKFLERFRYVIVASQLLNTDSFLGQSGYGQSRDATGPILDAPRLGPFTLSGAATTATVAFSFTWLIHWTRGNGTFIPGKIRVTILSTTVIVSAIILYTYVRKQWLQYLRQQSIVQASQFVNKAQEFDAVAAGALTLVQEVELVSRGYKLSTPLPPVSRLEDRSQTRRCMRLRKILRISFANIIPRYIQACNLLKPLAEEMDLDKYYDVYDISDLDYSEAMLGYKEGEFEDEDSVRVLKIFAARFHTIRKIFLCCLLAFDAHGGKPDFHRWGLAVDELHTLCYVTSEAEDKLRRILGEEESFPVPTTPKLPLTPGRERARAQLRKLNTLSSGIRGLQAKLHVLREESDKSLNDTEDVSELGSNLMMQYDSIGIDLKALMQEWEDGKAALAVNIDRNEKRVSSMCGMISPASSLGGLTAVEEGTAADALRALNGEARSRSSLEMSGSEVEEVFEAVAIPRQRSKLTREERIVKMKEDQLESETNHDFYEIMQQPFTASRKKRVFDSVFKKPEISEPTPVATPTGSFTTPSQSFGGSQAFDNEPKRPSSSNTRNPQQLRGRARDQSVDQINDQIQWDRSWHTVTHRLQLPDIPSDPNSIDAVRSPSAPPDPSFDDALKDVLDPGRRLPFALHTEDVLVWHTQQVRRHLLHQILPVLRQCTDEEGPEPLVFGSVRILDFAHRMYLHGLSIIVKQVELMTTGLSRVVLEKFRRDLHAIISNSLTDQLIAALRRVLENYVSSILGLQGGGGSDGSGVTPIDARTDELCNEMLKLVESLHKVGLAGENFQVIFAEIMNKSMTEYVNRGCKGLWSSNEVNVTPEDGDRRNSVLPRTAHHVSPSNCVTDLCGWIEDRYAKLSVLVFKVIDNVEVTWSDMEKWKEMSIGRLAALRTDELFDIVVDWPNSNGALHDLRTTITTPQRRLHLTEAFASTLKERLLHPGASTLLILQTYISMIWSFHSLDHSKVLLDRVAYPLQLYLCSREDTVRIIITGLLSDTEDAQGNPIEPGGDKLIELAQLLNDDSEQSGQKIDDEELDWHDMEWVPDPVDAGPGYKRSKSADIIGTLIGVLGSQEVFIKEFQNIIGENLLKNDGAFEKEIKVLELLKSRFGEAPLQSCEVMLKDILDSVRLDLAIHKTQDLSTAEKKAANPPTTQPTLHTKILSRLFWPALQESTFTLPPQITDLQSNYSTAFSSLKPARKLTWLPALGHTTVELELADRTVVEECTTWQATVISCFHSETSGIDAEENGGVKKSIEELTSELQMDSTLILSALKFWVSKLVLHESPPKSQIFSVLETLNASDRARSDALASAPANAGNNDDEGEGGKAEKGITGEHAKVYWQFVQSMLTNSSSQMGAPQIAMMLKMLIAEGFPYSNEELLEWLGGKVEEGALECVGGRYRLRK
ncbi:hypothetical protein NHQ30_001236 [Ciborinia camelliae]|nr:hypothetical protein NHQ30_001236 [Ciborinia camelliae]